MPHQYGNSKNITSIILYIINYLENLIKGDIKQAVGEYIEENETVTSSKEIVKQAVGEVLQESEPISATIETPVDATIPVSGVDNMDNETIADVIGNKNDTTRRGSLGNTLFGLSNTGYYHIHSPARCFPKAEDPILLTSPAGEWTFSDYIPIIQASDLDDARYDFSKAIDIHWSMVSDISASDYYELEFWKAPINDVENKTFCGEVAFVRTGNFVQEGNLPIQVPVIPPNHLIWAKIASGSVSSRTCRLKIYYHDYPNGNG